MISAIPVRRAPGHWAQLILLEIPTATDFAFALAVLACAGGRTVANTRTRRAPLGSTSMLPFVRRRPAAGRPATR